MTIIIPMSGDGRRFREAGYSELKPFIEIDGMPMIEHVINCFPGETNIILISQQKHFDHQPYRETLQRIAPSAHIVTVPERTLGPVPAILAAESVIPDDDAVIVNYCDFSVGWDYPDFKSKFLSGEYDGAVTTYTGFHPHLLGPNVYAGVLANDQNEMTTIQEKHSFTEDKMASRHSSGLYAFRTGSLLKEYCHKMIDQELLLNGEYYASMLYVPMLEDKRRVMVYDLPHFLQWGTPQDLEEYKYWSGYFARKSTSVDGVTRKTPKSTLR